MPYIFVTVSPSRFLFRQGDDSAKSHPDEGRLLNVRLRDGTQLQVTLVKVARIYGESNLLLEASDESRNWLILSSLAEIQILT